MSTKPRSDLFLSPQPGPPMVTHPDITTSPTPNPSIMPVLSSSPTTIHQLVLTPSLTRPIPASTTVMRHIPFLNLLLHNRHDLDSMRLFPAALRPTLAHLKLLSTVIIVIATASPAPISRLAADSRLVRVGIAPRSAAQSVERDVGLLLARRPAGAVVWRGRRCRRIRLPFVSPCPPPSPGPLALTIRVAPLVTVIRTPEITVVESAGEVSRDHSFQSRQARTQDPDVHFERRPDRRERIVPGDVCVVQED
jgi:hypothetical protein